MTTTEEYDGTNWSSGGALPVGKQSNDCFGNIVTAIRNVGGNTSPANYVSTTESYDGTNWTSGPTMLYGADRLAACRFKHIRACVWWKIDQGTLLKPLNVQIMMAQLTQQCCFIKC